MALSLQIRQWLDTGYITYCCLIFRARFVHAYALVPVECLYASGKV